MPDRRGPDLRLSLPRRFVCDLLHFAKKVPSVPMQRRMQLVDLVTVRKRARDPVSWCAIFLKAYAIVAHRRPELRRAFLSFPWQRLYEHPTNLATFTVERDYRGESGVFVGRVSQPELLSLDELSRRVRWFKTAPLESVDTFRQALLLSRFPRPIRRLVWWLGLSIDGLYRARFFGTYGVSVVGAIGAASLHLLSPLTTVLNYGTFEPDGSLDVRLTYDHRVFDGATAARAIVELEEVLRGEILLELESLAAKSPAGKSIAPAMPVLPLRIVGEWIAPITSAQTSV